MWHHELLYVDKMILLHGYVIKYAQVCIVDDMINVLKLGSWLFDLHLKCGRYLELLVDEFVMGSLALAECILASQREVVPGIGRVNNLVAILST